MFYFFVMIVVAHLLAWAEYIVFPGVPLQDRIQTCLLIAIFATMCANMEEWERWRKESRKKHPP